MPGMPPIGDGLHYRPPELQEKQSRMATVEMTAENFEATVTGNDTVLVDFWASWCGPCRQFAPVFEQAAETHSDLVFAKVDTEAQQELAAGFGIQSIPTLMVFRENIIVFAQPGALPASALEDLIAQVRALDMEKVHAAVVAQNAEHADHAHQH